ncbi:hypothetical protein FF36_00868 [Frankia torreyi]|uniref:YcfA-like protein n=1 Tax=Frankia torreyi TaxID=1856 RepID=A0A0D8BL56_9ACTN|nr:hypothetical protein FF36_00868 [Frankia torreyi]
MPRSRHPIKELEAFLRQAESQSWRVEKGKKYFKIYCPCGEHKHTVHLTPSDPRYEKNLRGHLKSRTCWEEAP